MSVKKLLVAVLSLVVFLLPLSAQKTQTSGKEPLFGKALASYPINSRELSGACFYLVGGHGGPDPGAIGTYQGHKLHEDEYAYDIVLRLGRELMMRGAKVHFIIQDKKDGIRNEAILKNSERNLYVLRNTQPAGVYLELGNIRNSRDQQRLVLENNRQALAKWIAEAIVADYKGK